MYFRWSFPSLFRNGWLGISISKRVYRRRSHNVMMFLAGNPDYSRSVLDTYLSCFFACAMSSGNLKSYSSGTCLFDSMKTAKTFWLFGEWKWSNCYRLQRPCRWRGKARRATAKAQKWEKQVTQHALHWAITQDEVRNPRGTRKQIDKVDEY